MVKREVSSSLTLVLKIVEEGIAFLYRAKRWLPWRGQDTLLYQHMVTLYAITRLYVTVRALFWVWTKIYRVRQFQLILLVVIFTGTM